MEAAETIKFQQLACYFMLNMDFIVLSEVRQLCHVVTTHSVQHQSRCLGYDSYILCTPHMECVPTLGVLAVKAVS